MRNRSTVIRFPVFNNFEVRVIIARDVAATGRRLKEDLTQAEAAWITKDDRPGVGWLVLPPDASPGILGHEATHAVRSLFAYTGMTLEEEAFAYHVQYIVDKTHTFMARG